MMPTDLLWLAAGASCAGAHLGALPGQLGCGAFYRCCACRLQLGHLGRGIGRLDNGLRLLTRRPLLVTLAQVLLHLLLIESVLCSVWQRARSSGNKAGGRGALQPVRNLRMAPGVIQRSSLACSRLSFAMTKTSRRCASTLGAPLGSVIRANAEVGFALNLKPTLKKIPASNTGVRFIPLPILWSSAHGRRFDAGPALRSAFVVWVYDMMNIPSG
jgi:hypothetical protein